MRRESLLPFDVVGYLGRPKARRICTVWRGGNRDRPGGFLQRVRGKATLGKLELLRQGGAARGWGLDGRYSLDVYASATARPSSSGEGCRCARVQAAWQTRYSCVAPEAVDRIIIVVNRSIDQSTHQMRDKANLVMIRMLAADKTHNQ